MEKMLTVKDVAERYSINIQTVYRWVDDGRLKAVRLADRCIRFKEEDLREFETAHENGSKVPVESEGADILSELE